MKHLPWHRESDSWTFYIALDAEGRVRSAYYAERRVEPGMSVEWLPCDRLGEMTTDMLAGGWHPMGGPPVDWPCSVEEPVQ